MGVFGGLTALTELYLHNNSLSDLQLGVFHGFTALRALFLDGNSLRYLPAGVFHDLTALEALGLSSNDLITLPAGGVLQADRTEDFVSGRESRGALRPHRIGPGPMTERFPPPGAR